MTTPASAASGMKRSAIRTTAMSPAPKSAWNAAAARVRPPALRSADARTIEPVAGRPPSIAKRTLAIPWPMSS
jgi:hypothetical protein